MFIHWYRRVRNQVSKRKKLPLIGYKINQRTNPEEENAEIHSILLEQKELLLEKKVEIEWVVIFCELFPFYYNLSASLLPSKLLISAEWNSEINEAKVVKNSGSSLSIFGHKRNRCVYLYPEETLFLIEMVIEILSI